MKFLCAVTDTAGRWLIFANLSIFLTSMYDKDTKHRNKTWIADMAKDRSAPLPFRLSLDWHRCLDGIELANYEDRSKAPNGNVPSSAEQYSPSPRLFHLGEQYFGPRSTRVEQVPFRLSELSSLVVLQFLNSKTDAALKNLFAVTGLPLRSFQRDGVPQFAIDHADVLEQQYTLNQLLSRACVDGSIESLDRYLYETTGHELSGSIVRNQSGSLQLTMRASYLSEYMVWEIVAAALNSARLATCEHCGILFLTGHLTGRGAHARFHADRCRVAAMRARNAGKDEAKRRG
jgi:hypothetical protein